jgi:hypothetical protein
MFVTALSTTDLFDADLFAGALEDHGIQASRQIESSLGVRSPMPAAPHPGLGGFWLVLVREGDLDAARQLLQGLGIEPKYGVQLPHGTPHTRVFVWVPWVVWAGLLLLAFGVARAWWVSH